METITETLQQKVARLLSASNAEMSEVWETIASARSEFVSATEQYEITLPLKAWFYSNSVSEEALAIAFEMRPADATVYLMQARALALLPGDTVSLIDVDDIVGTACRTTGVRATKVRGLIIEAELKAKDTDWLYGKLVAKVNEATKAKREPRAEDVQARLNINRAINLLTEASGHLTDEDRTTLLAFATK